MGWSISLGRLAGTEVRIHLTFLILLAWIGLSAGMAGGRAEAIDAVAFVVTIFACVLAHEFGHALVARHYGITTRSITLLPIGGVAAMERIPEKPGQELAVALAGPAVNAVIALVLVVSLGARAAPDALAGLDQQHVDFLSRVASVNLMLALFNLLPAFPMDGGRVLRAFLSLRMGRARATQWAARIGQGLALVLGFIGLFGNPLLIFVAIFVYLAASAEAAQTELAQAARHVPVADAMVSEFHALKLDATIGDAVKALLATSQHEFPVLDGAGRLRGLLDRDHIIRALAQRGELVAVSEVMADDIPQLGRHVPLNEAIAKLSASPAGAVGIADEAGKFIGLVTAENLGELMLVRRAADAHDANDRTRTA